MAVNGLLTTVDNPFDPYSQWTEWLSYDRQKNYFTCELIASIAHVGADDTEQEINFKLSMATEKILEFSPFHLVVYPKVVDGGEGSA